MPKKRKNPAAVALGRLGGLKGGPARMRSMSREERSALGRAAAEKRWGARRSLKRHVEHVQREQARLQPLLPQVDPHDLGLILSRLLKAPRERAYFIKRVGDRYVR